MNKTNTILKGVLVLAITFIGFSFVGCNDDEEVGNGTIVGNTYKCHDFYIDEDGWGSDNTTTITFNSSTSCEIKAWGYDYTDYDKERYSWTERCSYSISGNIITIKNSPLLNRREDEGFKNCGSYLERLNNGNKFFKQ